MMTRLAGKARNPEALTLSLPQRPPLARYACVMDMPTTQPASSTEQHMRRARYFRTMALTASTADVAITLVQLAVHYERLAKESALGTTSTGDTDLEQPVTARPRQPRSTTMPGSVARAAATPQHGRPKLAD